MSGFIGRERELAALTSALEAGRRGRGSVHLLVGEGGIGKSRLTGELAERARARGFAVVTSRAYPVETGIPYALFADGFVPLLREFPSASVQAITRGGAAELGVLFPTLRGPDEPRARGGEPAEPKPRLLDAFNALLTGGRPARRSGSHRPDPAAVAGGGGGAVTATAQPTRSSTGASAST